MNAARIGAAVAVALGLWSGVASADEEAPVVTEKGKITIRVKITGRRQHPTAAIDVARLVPRAPLPELKKPLVDRIGTAVESAPF